MQILCGACIPSPGFNWPEIGASKKDPPVVVMFGVGVMGAEVGRVSFGG
jgi:hypothetical protein